MTSTIAGNTVYLSSLHTYLDSFMLSIEADLCRAASLFQVHHTCPRSPFGLTDSSTHPYICPFIHWTCSLAFVSSLYTSSHCSLSVYLSVPFLSHSLYVLEHTIFIEMISIQMEGYERQEGMNEMSCRLRLLCSVVKWKCFVRVLRHIIHDHQSHSVRCTVHLNPIALGSYTAWTGLVHIWPHKEFFKLGCVKMSCLHPSLPAKN